jgi:hypothetical protein
MRRLAWAVKMVVIALVSPERFGRAAAEEYRARGVSDPGIQKAQTELIRVVRRSWGASALSVLGAIAFGWLVGGLVRHFTHRLGPVREITQYSGAGILLWATLGRVGWGIQTPEGDSLSEKVNDWFYRGMQLLGTVLLTVSVSWPATYG